MLVRKKCNESGTHAASIFTNIFLDKNCVPWILNTKKDKLTFNTSGDELYACYQAIVNNNFFGLFTHKILIWLLDFITCSYEFDY